MSTLEILSEKINSLKEQLSQLKEQKTDEKSKLESQIAVIEKCETIMNDEELMLNYDFTTATNLIQENNYRIDDLLKIMSDIQNVLQVRKELNISNEDMPLEENQVSVLKRFLECLKKIKEEINKKLLEITTTVENERKIGNLESLKNILEGIGRRKYVTDEMFETFYNEFDILTLPPEQAQSLLETFYQTRNLNIRREKEKIEFSEVVELYKEFLSPLSMKLFEELLEEHKNEIINNISLDNARDILQFFKEKKILENFQRTALLKITLYGDCEYIKEEIYPRVIYSDEIVDETFYQDDLATIWVKKKGTSAYQTKPFRISKGHSENNDIEFLFPSCHTVDYDEFFENIEMLKANSQLFGDKYDFDDLGANLKLKTLPVWVIKKNIDLCKIFGMGIVSTVPLSSIEHGDIENKIHLAIELGLLNPPMNQRFIEMDKEIVRNEEFQRNVSKKKIYNQSIRNYFQRCLSILSLRTVNEYAYMFYKLKNMGYQSFYNDFFSDAKAGQGNPNFITSQEKKVIISKEQMDDFVAKNFMSEWYSDFIEQYDEYDAIITEYVDSEKKEQLLLDYYFDSEILQDELVKTIEEENTIMDIITENGKTIQRKNEYVYLFGDRIISRYKFLHNASILKKIYGTLDKNMMLTAMVRNSFLDMNDFQQIHDAVMDRVKII